MPGDNGTRPVLSDAERIEAVQAASDALAGANTAKQVAEVWGAHYLVIGHRVLGRLLLGQTVEQATRRKRSKAA